MVTGMDMMSHDDRLQKHWLYRMVAVFIDGIIVFTIFGAIFAILDIEDIYLAGLISSLSFFLYSGISESLAGATIGKRIFGLKVRPLTSKNAPARIFFRNLPKVFWFIHLPVDVVIGLTMRGDPRQRFFDRIGQTTVVQAKEPDFHLPRLHNEKPSEAEGGPQ